MKVTIDGAEVKLKPGAKLKDIVKSHADGSLVSVHMSTEKLVTQTDDFEIVTDSGIMVLHLEDTEDAKIWKKYMENVRNLTLRWVTKDLVAFGAFPSDIPLDRAERRYKPYDCFFSLGGFDNHTTYMMIAREEHKRAYGAGAGLIGRITIGRHLLANFREGESIKDIRPVMSEIKSENVLVTDDLECSVDEGCKIETRVKIKLDHDSPAAAEQVLVLASKGYINITDSTGSFIGCRDDMDVVIPEEKSAVRDVGSVVVRNHGLGTGHMIIYKDRRQVSPLHNHAGDVESGMSIVARAKTGTKVVVETDPPRALAVGMTQAAGEEFLKNFGIKVTRTGDVSDDAIVAEQTPEMTMVALKEGHVETFGVPRSKVFKVTLDDSDGVTAYYFRKVTGLSHKPIGSMKVQFSFEGMPMVTFYGDEERSKSLYPQEPFKRCKKGDLGVTNQSRPQHGLIGIRLNDSKEYGPTGEEPYGTNMVGRFDDDVKVLKGIEEDTVIYITERKI